MHIRHITIMVNDLEKSIEFYETMTGLTAGRRFKAGPGEIAFMVNGENETQVELVAMPEGQKYEGKGWFICFETEDLKKYHELAMSKGLNPSDIRNPDPRNLYFYVYDPNGVSVELTQKL